MDRLRELVRLHRKGSSAREVVRLLRMGPGTERQYRLALARAGLLEGAPDELPELEVLKAAVLAELPPKPAPQHASSVEEWRPEIEALLDKGLEARATHDRLRSETKDSDKPFLGSYSAVKRIYRQIKRARGVRPEDVAIPVDTAPGKVAQVDFGYAGLFYDPALGVMRKTWVFVMVLCHSRQMYVQLVFDQKVETWLRLHEEAFRELGGVVEVVVPDNLKSAVIRAAFGIDDRKELNRSYRELAEYYDFKIDPTPPRSPKKKGKVESSVKYVKNNGLKGRQERPIDQGRAELAHWNREVASVRIHGTTGRRPIDMFEQEERAALRPLPARPYELVIWKKAKVHTDCHVAFGPRLYSVPWQLFDQEVWIRAAGKSVLIYHQDERVATHERYGPRRSTIESHLPEGRRDLRHRGREFWEERAGRIGPETLAHVREVFDQDEVLSQLRKVQAIVTHLEKFPRERAEAASRRARHFGNRTYQGVKQILARALDLEPLPEAAPTPSLPAPRFARRSIDFLNLFQKETTRVEDGRPDPALEEASPVRRAADA